MTIPPHDPQPLEATGPRIEPGRRLNPSRQGDRPWRLVITLLGGIVLLLMLLFLVAYSTTSWLDGRRYADVPATTGLGSPSSLTLSSDVGNVNVVHDADVDDVTLALVENGEISLPAEGDVTRAEITQRGGDSSKTVTVKQPQGPAAVPWDQPGRDLLLLIPDGHGMALTVTAGVGDVDIDGTFSTLEVTADVGDVSLDSVEAPDGVAVTTSVGGADIDLAGSELSTVDVTSSVGDVDVVLPDDAGGTVTVRTSMGTIDVEVPGSEPWDVEARSDVGEARVDPDLTRGADSSSALGTLTATSDIGDVTITR
ncbi:MULTISPECIES: DUF4097 family beta strand repeat-containing protein [Brachybacterium]|uniref:DUF4097 domain-containing protein n=1 Tax=Brachybacterium alimentarium TaxID=47845 RepID=A0A2A3YJY3_9MICO|nr:MULTISPECIES: DUF4097 family beta strand repeat-containing protein [Brachybacterium]PCC31528.1 hypothetical protein CIK71_14225 [Brachybacterium alimentarium]PCC39614.1 hypothetical protein CIK66_07820 [Brachybacterium alimentarium]RCS65093.1 hypothetical protein CIK81_07225 [Brachybacterium sp. JB7]RCS69730.1 hypothetical protein CIK73_04915 [Brachybacterium alimentarium]RCS76213.1 hypothetical protein CIK68_03130 [Brachybacterium alimentarium]